jgi:DNA-directed RNA polymerase I, II, and III subunit RPABC2
MEGMLFLTKYEKVRIIGTRAEQLENGAPPVIDIGDMTSSIEIAEKELEERKLPMIVIRNMPNGEKRSIPISQFTNDPYKELFG